MPENKHDQIIIDMEFKSQRLDMKKKYKKMSVLIQGNS